MDDKCVCPRGQILLGVIYPRYKTAYVQPSFPYVYRLIVMSSRTESSSRSVITILCPWFHTLYNVTWMKLFPELLSKGEVVYYTLGGSIITARWL